MGPQNVKILGPWGPQNGGALFSHDTGLDKTANLCEFPLTALYGAACDGYFCVLVEACALFASLRFKTLHTLSFVLICHLD